jgi:hypothetical protein
VNLRRYRYCYKNCYCYSYSYCFCYSYSCCLVPSLIRSKGATGQTTEYKAAERTYYWYESLSWVFTSIYLSCLCDIQRQF